MKILTNAQYKALLDSRAYHMDRASAWELKYYELLKQLRAISGVATEYYRVPDGLFKASKMTIIEEDKK